MPAVPLKNIAVFVDVSRASLVRATYAVRLALRYHAHLVGVFVVPLGWTLDPSTSFIRGRDAIRALIERQRAQELRTTATASERFENEAGREGISFEFRMIRATDTSDDGGSCSDFGIDRLHALRGPQLRWRLDSR